MAEPLSFHPSFPFVAARNFRCQGVDHKPGQSFNKTLVSAERLQRMFNARYIAVDAAGVRTAPDGASPAGEAPAIDSGASAKTPPPAPARRGRKAAKAAEGAKATEGAESASTAESAPAGAGPYSVKHLGFGRFYVVDAAGKSVDGPFTQAEARAKAADRNK